MSAHSLQPSAFHKNDRVIMIHLAEMRGSNRTIAQGTRGRVVESDIEWTTVHFWGFTDDIEDPTIALGADSPSKVEHTEGK